MAYSFLTYEFLFLTFGLVVLTITVKNATNKGIGDFLTSWGVRAQKIKRAVTEIERKTLHVCGAGLPLTYQCVVELLGPKEAYWWALRIGWSLTALFWILDIIRISHPWCKKNWPLQRYLRDFERDQLTGCCYFSLGVTLSVTLFSPKIAMCSILYLVLGDMSAALFGVAFGAEKVRVKLGRGGKKSAEGSLAMFCVCFSIGMCVFWDLHLREYPVFFGALAATLTELIEPLDLNDNLTIPFVSSLALHWGVERIRSCGEESQFIQLVNFFSG